MAEIKKDRVLSDVILRLQGYTLNRDYGSIESGDIDELKENGYGYVLNYGPTQINGFLHVQKNIHVLQVIVPFGSGNVIKRSYDNFGGKWGEWKEV